MSAASTLIVLALLFAAVAALVLPWRQAQLARAELARRLVRAEAEAAAAGEALRTEEAARAAAEAALRAAEERYVLALRGSQDGLWEWDLATDAVMLSPRWKSMLGCEADQIPDTKSGWLGRVHPEDLPALEQALAAHLRSTDTRFDHEMRLLHQDGRARWVLSRGVAIRRASGVPYRMVGLDSDVTRLKRIETVLDAVVSGTSGAHGAQFFPAMVQHFARALDVDCAFATECADHPPTRLRTLAFWSREGFADNFEYELAGTPCDEVVNGQRACFHRSGLGQLFPKEAGFEAYLGMPIVASDGRVLGHLAFLDKKVLGDEMLVESIYRIFLARAAAEMERNQALERLGQAAFCG